MYEAVLIIAIVAVDQISKYAVRTMMEVGQSIDVIEGFFALTYFSNDGAAFSSFRGQRALLVGVSAIAVVVTLIFLWINKKSPEKTHKMLTASLILICGGGIGNLIDRVAFGAVTDMLDFTIFPPIFNVADIAVTLGCFLLLIYVLAIEGRKKND